MGAGEGAGREQQNLADVSNGEHLLGETGEVCTLSVVAVLAIGFFSGESCWDHFQSRSLGITVTFTAWLIVVSLFFFIPSCLYISQIYQTLDEVKLK